MAKPHWNVEPPVAQTPPYGLLDVATVITDTSRQWRTGIEYDTANCSTTHTWGDWCAITSNVTDDDTQRLITITIGGTANPYTTTVTAQVDDGPDRQLRVVVDPIDGIPTTTYTTTGTTTTTHTSNQPITGTITITDILTGTTGRFNIAQNTDGTIQQPAEPVIIAVPATTITDECPASTVTYTITPTGDTYTVTVTATTTAETPRTLDITVSNQTVRVTLNPDAGPIDITDITPGTVLISARDITSSAYTSGWMYLGEGSGDAVSLVVSVCAAKEGQPPFVTMREDPFGVYARVECSAVGFEDPEGSARRALELSRGREVERVFWSRLVEGARDVVDGGVGVVRALAELEQYIASVYVGVGVIHTSPFGVAFLSGAGLLDATAVGDERLRTWRGTPVVVGAGYSRSGDFSSPVGGADFWMFVTGSVVVRQSDVFVRSSLDMETNVLSALAEQTVVVSDDCPVPGRVHVVPPDGA